MSRRGLQLGVVGVFLSAGLACTPIELARPLVGVPEPAVAPVAPLEVAWERNVDGALGPGAPVVTQDYLVMGTRRGDIAVVALADGKFEGASSFGRSLEGGLALAPDGRVAYISVADGARGVIAHDLVAGKRRWQSGLGPVETTPALVGSTVVVAALDGTVAGVAAGSGEALWTHRRDTTAAYHASPLAVDGDVVVASDRGRVERLDPTTGRPVWSVEAGEPVYTALIASSDAVLVPTTRGSLVAIDARTGAERWRAPLGDGVRVGAPTVAGDRVIVGTSAGAVVALELASGTELWRTQLEGVVRGRPALGAGEVYVGTMAKRLAALDLETGAVRWQTLLKGRVKTDLAVAGELLIVATEPRHVIALRTARPAL